MQPSFSSPNTEGYLALGARCVRHQVYLICAAAANELHRPSDVASIGTAAIGLARADG